MAEAKVKNKNLNADDILRILVETAIKDPVTNIGWDSRLGHGRVNASKAVEAVTDIP
jgi:hypothetical protein